MQFKKRIFFGHTEFYLFRESVCYCLHRFFITKHILECPIERVVESCCEIILIRSDISWVTVIYLSYLKHSCCITKLLPEISFHLVKYGRVNQSAYSASTVNQVYYVMQYQKHLIMIMLYFTSKINTYFQYHIYNSK